MTHNEECRFYYIPVYKFDDEVLDLEKTEFVDDTDLILDPGFKHDVIDKLDLYVSDKVKCKFVRRNFGSVL